MKVKGIINKVKARIEQVVSKVMDKAAALVAKVVGTGTNLANTAKDKGKAVLNRIKDGIFGTKKPFTGGKETHNAWVEFNSNRPKLMIASVPMEAKAQLKNIKKLAKGNTAAEARVAADEPRVNQITNKLTSDMTSLDARRTTLSDADYHREARLLVTNAQNSVVPIFAELFDSLGGGQTPVVGLHPIEDNRPDSSGEKRESHHVPADKFAIGMRNHYLTLSNAMPSAGSLGSLKTRLNTRAQSIPQNGIGLSAILIHRDTHRLADKAVHAKLSAAPTLALIVERAKKSAQKFQITIAVNGGASLAVNPSRVHWESFISKHFQILQKQAAGQDISLEIQNHTIRVTMKDKSAAENAQEIVGKIRSELANASADSDQIALDYSNQITDAMISSFNTARDNGIDAVQGALSESSKDGDKKFHAAALGRLRSSATATWQQFLR